MGRRKKELPPIKLVLGRSPDQKKGKQNANYTVLNQSVSDADADMRSKRRASNIDPKKWKETDTDDDDDLEIIQVYKPPPPKGPKTRLIPQQRTLMRTPSLLLECVDEELSHVQKQEFRREQTEFDKARQRIERIKKSDTFTEEILAAYIGPESTVVKHIPAPPAPVIPAPVPSVAVPITNNRRSASPDVVILDDPSAVYPMPSRPIPARQPVPVRQPVPAAGVRPTITPPQLQMNPNLLPRVPAMSRPQDVVLMGPNGQPIVIPGHLMPQGNQPIVLQANQTGQLQIVGSSGQTVPVIGRSMLAPNGKMVPPLAPRMAGVPNPNIRPHTPSSQNMNTKERGTMKRTQETSTAAQQPPVKRTRNRRKQQQPLPLAPSTTNENQDSVNWVPLDEYYYSKKEGDPAYREEKGEYRFKCFYCFKMLYNNLRIMMHIQGHIDSEKQQNLDLSDLTQCKHCYKQFDTPFEMQCHVEKIHQNRSNVLVCRICEKDHTSQGDLKGHMRMHNACEMPYICQLCNFRSSVYNDVVDHFKKRHDSSRYMVCLYCLKVFEIKFAKNAGWGMTQAYYQHLLKHQMKSTKIKCSWCKLVFNNKQELQMHKSKDHMPNYRGTQTSNLSRTVNASSEQVMIRVPDSTKSKVVKSLNAPVSQRLLLIGFCDYFGLQPSHMCIECRQPMLMVDHYKKYTECSMCRYATTCNEAFAVHMSHFHVRGRESRKLGYRERPIPKPRFCLCGFSSDCGNKIANHLISCSKRTCYSEKPEAKWFEYDDEQEEFNPFEPYCEDEAVDEDESLPGKDIPSLFGALGLVKKAPMRSYGSQASSKESSPLRESSPTQIAEEVIEGVLDAVFPGDSSSGLFINTLMNKVMGEIDDIEKTKFRSSLAIKASRRSSDNTSVNTESIGDQDDRQTESPAKSSLFNEDADDQDMSSVGGSDIRADETSLDGQERVVLDTAGDETSLDGQERAALDTAGDETSLDGQERAALDTAGDETSLDGQERAALDTAGDETSLDGQERSALDTAGVENTELDLNQEVDDHSSNTEEAAVQSDSGEGREDLENINASPSAADDADVDMADSQAVLDVGKMVESSLDDHEMLDDNRESVDVGDEVSSVTNEEEEEVEHTAEQTGDSMGDQTVDPSVDQTTEPMDDDDEAMDEDDPITKVPEESPPAIMDEDEEAMEEEETESAAEVRTDPTEDPTNEAAEAEFTEDKQSTQEEEQQREAGQHEDSAVDDNGTRTEGQVEGYVPSLGDDDEELQMPQKPEELDVPLPEETSKQPEESDVLLPEESSKPEESDVLLPEESSKPEESDVLLPEETSKQPEELLPEETSKQPEESDVLLPEETSKPEESDVQLPEETTKPEESDVQLPEETTKQLDIVPATEQAPRKPEVDIRPAKEEGTALSGTDTRKPDANSASSQISKEEKQPYGRPGQSPGRSAQHGSSQSRDNSSHNRDRFDDRNKRDDYRHSDQHGRDRNFGHDRNHDHDRHRDGYQDRNYHGSRDNNWSQGRDRYDQGQGRYDDRHGYHGNKGQQGNRGQHGNRGHHQGDRRDQRGGYRGGGGGGGYYGNRGGYY